ncbi:hypothetical protein Gasu2_69920 [Galdieria sulphuraria]|nr:hypothetical protein Gasu2_69920 [Galdieria sulphuraria]
MEKSILEKWKAFSFSHRYIITGRGGMRLFTLVVQKMRRTQSGFDSYSQEEDFSKSFSVENHVVCPDLNNVEMKRQCYPMEDYDEESVEINLGSSTYNGTDISSIYKYMQQRDEASLLLTRDRNSMYPSNFLSYSFATEGHSNRSQSSCNKDNVEKNSFKTCKEIVKEVPWTQCDEYLQECHDLMKANLMQSHLQLPKVSCPLNATRRRKRRKSKASPKDLLEQDASVLYKPTDWSQYELSSYRMAALARYYYKKHRRNYANKIICDVYLLE